MKEYKHSEYPYVTIFELTRKEIKRIDFAMCEQPKEKLEAFYARQKEKPKLLTNGGFFNMSNGDTCFKYIDEGELVADGDIYTKGIGIVDTNQLFYGHIHDRTDWRDFIVAYPPLIENGEITKITYATEISHTSRHTVLGYNDTNVFMITVDSPGLKFPAVQAICKELGCLYAINLDGGGSTRALVDGELRTEVAYSRPLDNVVAVYVQETRTIYRVQTGAFSKKAYANKLMQDIRKLPDEIGAGYANAYVRQVDGLYKVQVGAFSKKAGAERVVEDLAKLGYSSFITTK